MDIKFWGVRGSIPAPIVGADVEGKVLAALAKAHALQTFPSDPAAQKQWLTDNLDFVERSTVGGNTTCVEVRCGDQLIILDMGSGLRPLGNSLMPELFKNKGVRGTFLQSHVHWDHIQGFPFFAPLYLDRRLYDNYFEFFGGKEWDRSLDDVLHGQMDQPVFPVNMGEIEKTGLKMVFNTVWDGRSLKIGEGEDRVNILTRKLNHPQETFGYRLEHKGAKMAFCTDHEPYGSGVPAGLLELAKDVDVFVTDCQYSEHQYMGKEDKVERFGWGHSYPEYIARVAAEAKPKLVVIFHHDPAAKDGRVLELAAAVEKLSGIKTVAAYEGLKLTV